MTFRFTGDGSKQRVQILEMALEARFQDDTLIQALYANVNGRRTLIYRKGATGKWLSSLGISFNGLPVSPDNLIKAIDSRDPIAKHYVLPAA